MMENYPVLKKHFRASCNFRRSVYAVQQWTAIAGSSLPLLPHLRYYEYFRRLKLMYLFLPKANSDLLLQPKHTRCREEHTQLLCLLCRLEKRISRTTKALWHRCCYNCTMKLQTLSSTYGATIFESHGYSGAVLQQVSCISSILPASEPPTSISAAEVRKAAHPLIATLSPVD